jgi:hypothetical protein
MQDLASSAIRPIQQLQHTTTFQKKSCVPCSSSSSSKKKRRLHVSFPTMHEETIFINEHFMEFKGIKKLTIVDGGMSTILKRVHRDGKAPYEGALLYQLVSLIFVVPCSTTTVVVPGEIVVTVNKYYDVT